MGYRSDVTIISGKEAFKMFKKAWESVDFEPDNVCSDGELFTLKWEWVKWYEDYPEVDAIIKVMDRLDNHEESDNWDYAYSMIEIGEDNNVETRENQTFDDFYIDVGVHLPEGMKKEKNLTLEELVGKRYNSLEEIKKDIERITGKTVTGIIESESERPENTDFMIDFEFEEFDIQTIFYLKDNGNRYYITEV